MTVDGFTQRTVLLTVALLFGLVGPPQVAVGQTFFDVQINGTNSPITEGETLTVDAAITNTGDQADTQTIKLSIDGVLEDDVEVSLGNGESTTVTLRWDTQGGDAGDYSATVESEDASATTYVTVQEPPNFSVTIENTNSPVTEGEALDVTAFIENLGDATGTQTVTLAIDGSPQDSQSLTLSGGESQTITLSWATSDGDAGDYNAEVTSENDIASTSVSVVAPIPVELTSFDASAGDETVHLRWTTASETNNAGFEVQRRLPESSSWTALTFVEGEGTTTQTQQYQFRDLDVPYGADSLQYRLKQVDTDGTTSLSNEMVVTRRSPSEVALLGTYPNPTKNRMTVRFAVPKENADGGMLRLYDLMGREVRAIKVPTDAGRHKQTLTVSKLASGPYVLRLEVGGETQTERVTVVQ